ncbi:hypothetical protein BJ878DRAFT_535373 [Calycina marina]|uniref:Uncharacterized protein n=1 Tax=Calycina marina TaxID=1763456 RepID=A0A9P7Z167_9HELO|nr:hypothetical protein BJ878DRAFT_535373 [Calycina marina]
MQRTPYSPRAPDKDRIRVSRACATYRCNITESLVKPWKAASHSSYISINAKVINPVDGSVSKGMTVGIVGGLRSQWRDTEDLDVQTSAYRQSFVSQYILNRGFTTVRDCGVINLSLKKVIKEGTIQGSRIFVAGPFFSQTGGHGDIRGAHDNSAIECCGGGFSKFGSARENVRTGSGVTAITTVARNSQVYVTSHAYAPALIKQALGNGVLGLEHGNLIDKETAELMVAKGAHLLPTLVTYPAMAHEKHAGFMPRESMQKNFEAFVA